MTLLDYPQEGVVDKSQNEFCMLPNVLKDVTPLQHPTNPDIQAFSARSSWTPKAKVWRLGVYINEDGRWVPLADVAKVSNLRGSFKVWFTVRAGFWSESWFKTEAEAEKFLLKTWEFYNG